MEIGDKIYHLTVIGKTERVTRLNRHFEKWICRCDCGEEVILSEKQLLSGHHKTCGCQRTFTCEKMIGQKFGRWTVVDVDKEKSGYLICQCDCGSKPKSVSKANLLKGVSLSCGCLKKEKIHEALFEDLTGQRFGRLVVQKYDKTKEETTWWLCKCDCGNEVSVRSYSLKNGDTKSCGCYKSEVTSERFSKKLMGQKFGKLLVLERAGTYCDASGRQNSLWRCQCDCGTICNIQEAALVQGKTQSCGCTISRGEEQVRKILNQFKINFSTQFSFADLKSSKNRRLRYDFAILGEKQELVCLIEYQGIQHYKEQPWGFGKQQREETDLLKKQYCEQHSIPFYEISYDEDIKQALIGILTTHKMIPCQASQEEGLTTIPEGSNG